MLYGASGALLWGLLDLSADVRLVPAVASVVLAGLVASVARVAFALMHSATPGAMDGRFTVSTLVRSDPRAAMYGALRSAALLGMVVWLSDPIFGGASVLLYAWCFALLVSTVHGVLTVYWPTLLPHGTPVANRVRVIAVLGVGSALVGAAWFAAEMSARYGTFALPELRFALLTEALLLVIGLLVSQPLPVPLVSELTRLRRELSLGASETTDAASRLEAILLGLTFDQVVQREVGDVLAVLRAMRAAFDRRAQLAEDMLAVVEAPNREADWETRVRGLQDQQTDDFEQVQALGRSLDKKVVALMKKLRALRQAGAAEEHKYDVVARRIDAEWRASQEHGLAAAAASERATAALIRATATASRAAGPKA